MPNDRRKSIPKERRTSQALADHRAQGKKSLAKAREAAKKILVGKLEGNLAKELEALDGTDIDIQTLYLACLVDMAALRHAYEADALPAESYASKRLQYLDLSRKLAVSAAEVSPPTVDTITIHKPHTTSTEDWYCDPVTGEPLGREELNPEWAEAQEVTDG